MIATFDDERRRRIDSGWLFAIDEAGAFAAPASLPPTIEWRPARVPGTLAEALLADRATFDDLPAIDSIDAWYKTSFVNDAPGRLRLAGLASLADVFLDGVLALRSDNMFLAHEIAVDTVGRHDLLIRFRSVEREIASKGGRARWRPRMIVPAGLRHIRTTALGRLPGFAPPTPPVGPWRAVELIEGGALRASKVELRGAVSDGEATLRVALELSRADDPARLFCAGRETALERVSERRLEATLPLGACGLWSPHTHGEPILHAVEARIGDRRLDLGRTGFHDIRIERGADGRDFSVSVNGVPVFCRGACWTTADAVSLRGEREDCAPLLLAMRDAGMNMARVPGVTLYESDAFYALCDELGIMVWQDFPFANFDYPVQDAEFRASVEREAAQFLTRVQASPSLAVLCGGSEVYQQASMLGLAEAKWRSPLFDEILPRLAREHRPDVAYVENSPSGGALPFHADSGVSHYYGVGAYRRGLDDARRADVRFASECLGFSCIPEDSSLARDFGAHPLASPLLAARIPRDMGSTQTFGEVTEHYMRSLYGCDPEALRESDPQLYLDIGRAAVAEAMEATIGDWRRGGSTTHGAIVWFLKDMWPSPGWGVIDAHGEPKSAYHALKRAFRPLSLILTDEGVNGLFVHLRNDTPRRVEGEVSLSCFLDGRVKVMQASRRLCVEPNSAATLRDAEFWGGFFDTVLAYRFGPPSHDVTVATFTEAEGATIDAFHFPQGRSAETGSLGLRAAVELDDGRPVLVLSTEAAAQSVKIEDAEFRPADNWLHLPPGATRRIALVPRREGVAGPRGVVSALNGESVRYG
jgi:beta-mannosidase